ncbi:AAA family ATPase [Agathobacter sp.]|uniref:AAA family ATPase n=1 Tax=Agathobacter sp. TaxID=2021311 RepID=UPI003FD7E895
MAKKYVVTITRQFGSMGRPIAREMSEQLGIEYYDRDIVEQISQSLNLPVSTISQLEERYKSPNLFNMVFPLGFSTIQKQEQIFTEQTKIINDLVEKESCIIVGRCSDYLMRNHPNHLNIYIYSSYENRLKNCIERLQMEEDEARKMIQEVDKARDNYHRRFAQNTLPWDPIYKDIMIDSNLFGIEGTASYLTDIVKKKFEL